MPPNPAPYGSPKNPDAGYTPGGLFTESANFTRPADTTTYAANDMVGSILEFVTGARETGEAVRIERLRLRKTTNGRGLAKFRVHLFRKLPVLSAGVADNTAFSDGTGLLNLATIDGRIGHFDVDMTSGTGFAAVLGAQGVGLPSSGAGITAEAAGATDHETSVWAVIEALAAYAPGNAEQFVLTIEGARS